MAKSGSFDVIVDDSIFKKDVAKFLTAIGKEEKTFIREQSGMVARDLAKYTPPFMDKNLPAYNKDTVGTPADIRRGKESVMGDLKSICLRAKSKKYINKQLKDFGKNSPIYQGKRKIGFGILENLDDIRRWHYRNRSSQGRVGKVAYIDRPLVWESLFNKYVKKHKWPDVGMAKAGFYKASLYFGAKKTAPPNVKKNRGRATGMGLMVKTKEGWTGQVSSTSKGGANTLRHLPMIQKHRGEKAIKRLERLAKDRVKKDFS